MIADVRREEGESVCSEISLAGGEAFFVETDVTSPQSVERLIEEVDKRFGRLDVLVNNAAISRGDSFLYTSLEKWRATIEVNLTGVFLTGQKAAWYMIRRGIRGRIVNIASTNAFASEKGACPYVASKGGVNQLTKAMAVDLAEYGITVNAVAPGPVLTEANAGTFTLKPLSEAFARAIPAGGPGRPEDVAAAVGFLASDECRFINGATLLVDGGYLAYSRFE